VSTNWIPVTLLAVALTLCAAVASGAAVKKRKPASLAAPALQSPANDAESNFVPAFTWASVKGAERYEFQLSADGAFRSIVNGPGQGSFQTKNAAASINKALSDGNYFWRVRAVNAQGDAGKWSKTRTLRKTWSQPPALTAPATATTINYPDPVVLSWSTVPRAYKYEVEVATDPALGSPAPGFSKPVETSGTDFAIGLSLSAGRYYWAVTPLDGQKHKGQRSAVGSFDISWPSATQTRVEDLNSDPRVYDPQFSWNSVPGAARYEVEINSSDDFAPGSKVCCKDPTTGTSLSPTKVLPNNTGPGGGYFWRMRAIDVDGNAGVWNVGSGFPKYFSPTTIPSVPNLRLVDHTTTVPQVGIPEVENPVIAWDPAPGASSYEIQVAPVSEFATTFVSAAGTTVTVGSTARMVPNSRIHFANGEARRIVSVVSGSQLTIDSALASSPAPGSEVWIAYGFCNWTPGQFDPEFWSLRTAATAWSPLSSSWSLASPVGSVFTQVTYDSNKHLVDGESYCVRVRARGDRDANGAEVVSAWTELGNFLSATPTFEYSAPPGTTCSPMAPTQSSDYLTPAFGTVSPRLPFFAWKPVPGACSYYVVVARDESFTDVVDIGLTRDPEYAPRANSGPRTYPDESSSYFWAVIPSPQLNGGGVFTSPENNAPHQFQKRSVPPALVGPAEGATVTTQPSFRWTAAEGAREYRLQVAQDPSFSDPIEDVTTNATAFTSSSTYPADTVLYWRVRANDENKIGLAWSQVRTFRRELPAPVPSADNPSGGRTIAVLRWSPVEGAVSYDMHVDQPDGTQKDFTVRSTAFTPVVHYGTGVWQWKVRANFPKLPFGATPGAYTARQSFTRFIGSPAGARGVSNSGRMVLSWDPIEMAKSYKVEISNSSSFTLPVETTTTDNTSYAPKQTHPAFADGGTLYWRVASVDEGNNVGGYTSGTFSLPKRIKVTVTGLLRKGAKGAVKVKVTDARGRTVSKAKVRVTGAGIGGVAKRSSKRGIVTFKLRPRRKGNISFLASKGGYRSGNAVLRVAG
jgi:predicted RecA/RadA family phage recombinase